MVATMHRKKDGGLIDRSRPLSFIFNDQPCVGFEGDTLASAILANGVEIIGRSLVFNRPRNIMGTAWAEQNAYVRLHENGAERVVLASATELYEGLSCESLLAWPPPTLVDRVRGNAEAQITFDHLTHQIAQHNFESRTTYHHCDVFVIGSGPSGLSAARAAGAAGARVALVEMDREIGGSLLWCDASIDDMSSADWSQHIQSILNDMDDVHLYTRSTAIGLDENRRVVVLSARASKASANDIAIGDNFLVRRFSAERIILATGADERMLTFPDNDIPGVMLASALQEYAQRYAVVPEGSNIVLVSNNDDGYSVACGLHDSGLTVSHLVDSRDIISASLVGPVLDRGINLIGAHVVSGIQGSERIDSIELRKLVDGTLSGAAIELPCDYLAVSGGWNPRLDFLKSAGGTLAYSDKFNCLVPRTYGEVSHVVGSAVGDTSLVSTLRSGLRAGTAAATTEGKKIPAELPLPVAFSTLTNLNGQALWRIPSGNQRGHEQQWIDLKADIVANGLVGESSDESFMYLGHEEDVQLKSTRPAITLDTVLTRIDEEIEKPKRYLPTHSWHVEHGAAFRLNNQWLRPALYVQANTPHEETINAEIDAVRHSVGLHDLSSVGNIDIQGPDSGIFLDHMCCTDIASLAPNQSAYTMLLDESGAIFDLGVVTCISSNQFSLSTSLGTTERVRGWLTNWHHSDHAELQLFITSSAPHNATLLLTGPRARQVLLELDRDIDVSTSAFPFNALRKGMLADCQVSITRTGFTGEVSFEIQVAADLALYLWHILMTAGAKFGIKAFGEDCLNRLGAEKGRVDMPTISSNALSPQDISPNGKFIAKTADFVGKRALARPRSEGRERLQLVALKSDEPIILETGSTIFQSAQGANAEQYRQGQVLTSFQSKAIGKNVTLALVIEGHSRWGEVVHVGTGEKSVPLRISRPEIHDPNGRRRYG